MIDRLEEFCGLLRKNGIRVSTAEAIDAARALGAVGVARGERVRAALASALIKRPGDLPAFDELFSLYFLRGSGLLDTAGGALLAELLRSAGISPEDLSRLIEDLARESASMSAVARMGMGVGASDVAPLVRASGLDADLARIQSPLQVGFFSYRLIDRLGVRAAEEEVGDMLGRLMALGAADARALAVLREFAQNNFELVRRALREYVEEEFRRQNLDYMDDLAVRALADKPLTRLSDAEIAGLRREVRRLALKLRARVSLRPKLRKRGRLDLRRTLRRSLAAGGVPFVLEHRERERRKPRLVVLCDISDSVRNVSRFMLQFVYTLQELFDRVYSFAFVAEIGELSDLFRRHDLDRAIDLAYSGAAVNVFANSDYGAVLSRFSQRHMDRVTPRTTVLVIGDGRNNYRAANAAILGDIRRRAKQLLWLNPEAPAAWGFGDSAMREYQPHCDRVVVVYNLESLRKVVDELVI